MQRLVTEMSALVEGQANSAHKLEQRLDDVHRQLDLVDMHFVRRLQ